MALTLTLRPFEKVMINGLVLENIHEGKARFLIRERAHILRARDMMDEAEAKSPATRVYYQAMKLSGGDVTGDLPSLISTVAAFERANAGCPDLLAVCADIIKQAESGAFYEAMVASRKLIAAEVPDHPILRPQERQKTPSGAAKIAR